MSNQYLKNYSKQSRNKDVRESNSRMYNIAYTKKQPEQEFKRVF